MRRCPSCTSILRRFDIKPVRGVSAWIWRVGGMLFAVVLVSITALEPRVISVPIAVLLFGTLVAIVIYNLRSRTIWQCESCKTMYLGDALRPFDWSGYG